MRLRYLTAVLVISTLFISACTKDESVKLMPVTTDSELALAFYETGMLAYDQLKHGLAIHNLELAVREDQDFFMAYFWLYFMSGKSPKKVAEGALQADLDLNEAERHIKTAFKYLLDGQEEKVVENLKLAVDLYPSDPQVYKILYILQFQILKDFDGAIETIDRAIDAVPDYALAYNQLGYALMNEERIDEAEEAFDNYIRLAPELANPYDSKGDFYMHTKQFEKAYESYMKAYEIDSDFTVSEKKAKKAKYLMAKEME
jgi:tetratricopeptide (TPR) repeat protein